LNIQDRPEIPRSAALDRLGEGDPWIETRAGSLFFVNALLASPALLVLIPLTLGTLLRVMGVIESSPFFDSVPAVAAHFVPVLGWLAVVPMGTTVMNLRMEQSLVPRLVLMNFLLLHICVLTYTFWRWFGAGP